MLSIIIPVLNSHEIFRRQLIHFKNMNLPDEVEIIIMDDGSDTPLTDEIGVKNLRIIPTNDTRQWTSSIARNTAARLHAKGDYFLMTDIDYIIPKEAIYAGLAFTGDKMRFRREFAILDENGTFIQDEETLLKWGLLPERIKSRGFKISPHPNNFVISKEVFWKIGGYDEELISKNPYPQGEDRHFKRDWSRLLEKGEVKEFDFRPTIYMFPNGQFCGDVDYNPFDMFHTLSRKNDFNPFTKRVETSKEPIRKHNKINLSVIIPARNEEFLERTINDVLDKAELNTEVICILDGYWPDPPIKDRPNLTFVHHYESIGQRAATNEGAKISNADYVMKLDAHCILDQGFDRKLIEPYEDGRLAKDTTTIPRMYNLYGFDWVCSGCGKRTYQGPRPTSCECKGENLEWNRDIIWKPRFERMTESWMFDKDMHFQYWISYGKRPEFKGDIVDVMCSIGACFIMPRERFFEIGGLDENHGSWGQFGVEIACKSWLSGGRHVVNKNTWFSHLFRTQKEFGFPYHISGNDQERARTYSRDLWLNDKWDKAVRPLSWIVEKFKPVPTWEEAHG